MPLEFDGKLVLTSDGKIAECRDQCCNGVTCSGHRCAGFCLLPENNPCGEFLPICLTAAISDRSTPALCGELNHYGTDGDGL